MAKSFFRKMIEERELIDHIFVINFNGLVNVIEMEILINEMEATTGEERKFILNTLSQIDFENGDILEFMELIAKSYIEEKNPIS